MTCHHCEAAPANVLDDAKTLGRCLCDDCANDLRVSARKPNATIHDVTIEPL